MPDRVLLATANPHKLAELRPLLAPLAVVGLDELANTTTEPAETGRSFEENAAIKAIGYAQQTGLPCLADDSGLEVDALAGAPGVISSHYATGGRETGVSRAERDAANNQRLLADLEGVPWERRGARFVCVLVLADAAGRVLARARGVFEGRIGVPPRVPAGENGFGYDPLFLVAPGFDRTSAQLPATEKNRLSHRAAAAAAIAPRAAAAADAGLLGPNNGPNSGANTGPLTGPLTGPGGA